MQNIIVFHSPWPVEQEARSGSTLRPLKIRDALYTLGLEVISIDGYSKERKLKWKQVANNLSSIIGVYSELRTIPIALSDSNHLPRHPFMDLAQFRALKKQGIPTTIFYRDIFWRFPMYTEKLSWQKRWPTKLIYYLEFMALKRYVSHFFIPSLAMANHFPFAVDSDKVSALPPGCCLQTDSIKNQSEELQLLYVGGILPPIHDISPMVKTVRGIPNVRLTLCCREEEWQKMKGYYGETENIHVTHSSGDSLAKLFLRADALLMYWKMDSYLQFAMPVKLFEALGYGLPIITNAQSEMGDFVSSNGIGWSLNTESDLHELLRRLRDKRNIIENIQKNVIVKRHEHTWQARAAQVVTVLKQLRHQNLSRSC